MMHQDGLSLQDKVAFAVRFLPDASLQEYLRRLLLLHCIAQASDPILHGVTFGSSCLHNGGLAFDVTLHSMQADLHGLLLTGFASGSADLVQV